MELQNSLLNTSNKYAAYLQSNPTLKDQVLNDIDTSIAKYEEMNCFFQENHSVHRVFLEDKIPELNKFSKDLNAICHSIDNLQDLVKKVEADVRSTEMAVTKAELDLKMNLNIPATFKPLLIMKEPPHFSSQNHGNKEFVPPKLKFDSKSYFV